MQIRPYSATLLMIGGVILTGLGLYFIFIRPPLLPEDLRYMGASLAQIQASVPGLSTWLRRVFWVMGGYMFATGVLTCHIAATSFRARTHGTASIVALAGAASIGWMAVVNFIIASDFKWVILAFTVPWALALALYWTEKDNEKQNESDRDDRTFPLDRRILKKSLHASACNRNGEKGLTLCSGTGSIVKSYPSHSTFEETHMQHQHSESSNHQPPYWKSRTGIALIMLALVVAFYLLREHWAHVVGNWPYLLLLLCPLMHLFGHGGHSHADQAPPDDKNR